MTSLYKSTPSILLLPSLSLLLLLLSLLLLLLTHTHTHTLNPTPPLTPVTLTLSFTTTLTLTFTSFNSTSGCLSNTSEVGAEKLSSEIFDHLSFMSESYSNCTAEAFKEFVMLIFCNLQESMNDPSVPEELNGRYCALVYLIMHHFLEIRHKIASGVTVSAHVLPALDALAGVDTAKDVKLIFRLLEVCMRTADPISFADVSTDEMDGTAENGMDNSGNTMVSNINTNTNTNGVGDDLDFSQGKAGQPLAESPVPLIWKNSGGPGAGTGMSGMPDSSPLPDDGDSLHGVDILMVEMDEFSTNMFDESDCDNSPAYRSSEKSDNLTVRGPGKNESSSLASKVQNKLSGSSNADSAAENVNSNLEIEVSEDGLGFDSVGGSDSSLSPPSISEILSPLLPPGPGAGTVSHGELKDPSSATPRNKAFYDWVKVTHKHTDKLFSVPFHSVPFNTFYCTVPCCAVLFLSSFNLLEIQYSRIPLHPHTYAKDLTLFLSSFNYHLCRLEEV